MIQHVRERFSCSDCETIAQAPARSIRSRADARARTSGRGMMAKFGLHLPLHRRAALRPRGRTIDVSTLAGWVGAVTTALSPLVTRIEAHVRGG